MANRFYAVLIVVAVGALLLWNSVFVVNEREQAIVLRFGEIRRVVDEPGLYFKLPLSFLGADNVQMLPDRLLRFDLDDIRVQVSGGKFYEVDAFLVYNIADAARFRQTVSGSVLQAEQRLRTRLDAALRRVYGLRGFEAALSDERGESMTDTGPLNRLKKSMKTIKDEIREMDLRLGTVSHNLLHIKMAQGSGECSLHRLHRIVRVCVRPRPRCKRDLRSWVCCLRSVVLQT